MTVQGRMAGGQAVRLTLLLALAGMGSLWGAGVAKAQSPAAGFGASYGANAGKPIDIESDTLEVNDKNKTAVFKGNVSATQGDMNLKSNELHVLYTSGPSAAGGKTASATTSDATASPLGGSGNITFIDAEGNVLVTMNGSGDKTQMQTAKSDRAHFDVVKQLVTLTGNVELANGDLRQNVIVGNKLVINITEGTSHLENSGTADAEGKPKRIQAIFAPPPKDKDKDKTKPKEGLGAILASPAKDKDKDKTKPKEGTQ